MRRLLRIAGAMALPVTCALSAAAQGTHWVRCHYTKEEALIPMRDGVNLFTSIYTPKDRSKRYPILLNRTPYSIAPYGKDCFRDQLGPSPSFARDGFIFVYQDVRGRFMSEGHFINMTPHRELKATAKEVDESSDTYDTIAWLIQHLPSNNGKVGQWGISYPGFYAAAGMIDAHPALVAVSPQAPIMDWFTGDDFHRNGALWLPHLFNFIADFGRPRPAPTTASPKPFEHGTDDGYAFFLKLGPLKNANARYFHGGIPFWDEVMSHGTYDEYWKARNLRPHLRNIKPAVLVVGGWFDAENLYGSLQAFHALESQSPKTPLFLVMGPWVHGGWERDLGDRLGDLEFGSATSDFFLEQIEFPFFQHYLKDGPDPRLPKATVFKTGTNQWQCFEAWPPKAVAAARVYFQSSGKLGFVKPTDKTGWDEFVSDPSRPVPFYPRRHIGMPADYMVMDQRFVATRSDVRVYETEPLISDLTIAGPIRVHLEVSTTGTDADWVVKLIDVHPDGKWASMLDAMAGCQQLVRGEVMRGKFRNGFEHPVPFTPGQPATVAFSMNDVFHSFQKGHRLMVQVQSSWFPLMDRNPQIFKDIYSAEESDFHSATHRIHRSEIWASYLELPVLK